MTSTTVAQPRTQRWPGVVIGLLIGLAAVCHGCHVGDRDDELSFSDGKARVESHPDQHDTSLKRERR